MVGVVWCAGKGRETMKRTKTKKQLRGISELAQGLYFIRVQEVHPRTGKMVDVRKRVRCETIEEAVQAQAKLRAEELGDRDLAQPRTGSPWGLRALVADWAAANAQGVHGRKVR
jgi:hypothetical protein